MKLVPTDIPWRLSACDEVAEFDYNINGSGVDITVVCNYSPKKTEERINEYIQINNGITEEIENGIGVELVKFHADCIAFIGVFNSQKPLWDFMERYSDGSILSSYDDEEKFFRMWNEENICPDPGVYKIVDSVYFDLLGLDKSKYTHWVFDISTSSQEIHVIAKTLEWSIVEDE